MNTVGIIGSGELGVQILNIARQQGRYSIMGFFDDYEAAGTEKHGLQVLGPIKAIENFLNSGRIEYLVLAIGYKHMTARKELFERLSRNARFATIVHPFSFIDPTARVAPGCVIYPGVIIDKNVAIHENVVLNNGCIVSHDTIVGAHSFLAPNTAVASFVTIGECNFLGISTTIIDQVSTAGHVQTGGGCVVIKDLQQPGVYVGNPARFLR